MSGALALPVVLALARACSPQVAAETLVSVAAAESGLDPLVIGVNTRPGRSLHPRTPAEAAGLARDLRASGTDFDLGLTQLNVRNLARLGMTIEQAFDPCRNLAGGGRILTEAYLRAAERLAPAAALNGALSAYNTGDAERGLRNGYVARIHRAAARVVPRIASSSATTPAAEPAGPAPIRLAAEIARPRAPLDAFARTARAGVLVWNPPADSADADAAPPPSSNGDAR